MKYRLISLLSLFFIFNSGILFSQEVIENRNCIPAIITDQRDLPENIPGETMGQKLESLLFWSQEEKERRFPMMQSIYPSLPVAVGENPYSFKEGKTIQPQWDDSTDLDTYMKKYHIGGVLVLNSSFGVDKDLIYNVIVI